MVEPQTITEVGNVRIEDDGYEHDRDVCVYVNDEEIMFADLSDVRFGIYSGDLYDAMREAKEWYDNGRTFGEECYVFIDETSGGDEYMVEVGENFVITPTYDHEYHDTVVFTNHPSDLGKGWYETRRASSSYDTEYAEKYDYRVFFDEYEVRDVTE